MPPVRFGVDVLAQDGFRSLQVGVVTNATGVLADMTHLVDALHRAEGVNLVAIFGPEHGFRGGAQAGSAGVRAGLDARTQVPVIDIYQKRGKALRDIFRRSRITLLLFDIQDVGARFYTYIWTLYDCLVAAALCSPTLPVVVADRPNPLGGESVAGPLMSADLASFVGRKPIALRHGCTIGELALLFNAQGVPDEAGKEAVVRVVRCEGWRRSMQWGEVGRAWVPPSPNMPSPSTAMLYPGMCLFEGTNCCEGRGTTLPFQMVGAPWVDLRFADAARSAKCEGVLFREAHFTPTSGSFSGKVVTGVQVHIVEASCIDPLHVALTLLCILKGLYPNDFVWKLSHGSYWVDKLWGNSRLREGIDTDAGPDEIMALAHDDVVWFEASRQRFLLYT